jgi:hypothetical protein
MIINFRNHKDWTLVSNSVKAGGNFVVLDLNPATWYQLYKTVFLCTLALAKKANVSPISILV